jgi:hypothetical protein
MIARACGPMIAVGELEPGAGEGVGELPAGSWRKRREIFAYSGSKRSDRSVVSMVGFCFFSPCAEGIGDRRFGRILGGPTGWRRPATGGPAPTRSRRGSRRRSSLHCAGVWVQVTSSPEADGIRTDDPCRTCSPFQPKPWSSRSAASGFRSRRARDASAPWVLPKVCPPAMSATVSSSFMAMRLEGLADVALGRLQADRDCRWGPSGLT